MLTGTVVWFVGRPGAGKSFAARQVHEQLRRLRVPCLLLDGDEVRSAVVPPHGYGDEGRRDHYATLANLAARLARQGLVVLVPATAPRQEFRDHARRVSPAYLEVYVDVTLEAAMRQDEGRDGAARVYGSGSVAVPGVSAPFETPASPDVVVDMATRRHVVERVLARLDLPALVGDGLPPLARMSYLGVALDDAAHQAEQRAICARFAVEPRPELHLTLAFLGDLDLRQLCSLQREILDADLPWQALRLDCTGVGGSDAGARRVLWWSVAADEALLKIRAAVAAARRLVAVAGDFSPHVTLGSAGDLPFFDVHDVAKLPDREPHPPRRLSPLVAHLTSVTTHPSSLLVLHRY